MAPTPLGLAGAAVYVLGHGMVKAALFLCAGMLLNRFQTVNEAALHGRGRDMLPAGILFAAGGLALAGLPPFGTYLGKGMIEDAAASHGFGWLTDILIVASMLTGGAVLRAAARVFLGLGEPEEDEAAREGTEEQPESTPSRRTPVAMLVPACVLMGLGLAVGLVPDLGMRVEQDAARFVNQASYSQVVLDGAPALLATGESEPAGPTLSSLASGVAASAGAVLLALASIYRRRAPDIVCNYCAARVEPPLQRLRALQSGDVRDYVAWLTFGVAGLGAAFVFLVR